MNKKLQHIALALIGLLVLNYVANSIYKRFDLTQDKRYTLSEVSESLIDKIDAPLTIHVFLEGDFPAEFKRLQIETRQFLEELQAKNSNIRFRFINPDNIRERLVKRGMMPSQLTVEEDGKLSEAIIFPWAEITYGKKVELISLLPNSIAKTQEAQLQNAVEKLEYSFANALHNVTLKERQKIAVLAGNGELQDIYQYSLLSEIGKKYRLAKFTLDSVANNPQKNFKRLKSIRFSNYC